MSANGVFSYKPPKPEEELARLPPHYLQYSVVCSDGTVITPPGKDPIPFLNPFKYRFNPGPPKYYLPCNNYGFKPKDCICPHCSAEITTDVTYDVGIMACLIFAALCIVGLWPCACIPFCVECCEDAVHTCPECSKKITKVRRL